MGLGFALLESAGRVAGDRARRLAILLEARSLFTQIAAFLEENREEKLAVIPEALLREFEAAVRRCDESIAKLAPA